MDKKTALVIPCRGIGDALLMMIASEQLKVNGYEVTTVHSHLHELQSYFPGHHFQKELPQDLNAFDLVIVENDNSAKIKELVEQFENKKIRCLKIFYPTYSEYKNFPLTPFDHVFDKNLPMAQNIAIAIAIFLNSSLSDDNGITIPNTLVHRRHLKRIAIHPTSSDERKNWKKEKYLNLARELLKKGFEPVYTVQPLERKDWLFAQEDGIKVPEFPTLSDLAAFLYESGLMIGNDSAVGHLASNLKIPTLIISDNKERMRLWRPGWFPGEVVTPSGWVNYFKFFRSQWQRFISEQDVLNVLEGLLKTPQKRLSPQTAESYLSNSTILE